MLWRNSTYPSLFLVLLIYHKKLSTGIIEGLIDITTITTIHTSDKQQHIPG